MGLRGIELIADDILVVGCGDSDAEAESDHDRNHRALMELLGQRHSMGLAS